MQTANNPSSPARVIATAAVLVAAAALISHFAAPAANAAPAAGLVSAAYVSPHEGVDWSRVPAVPVSTGATVGAYD